MYAATTNLIAAAEEADSGTSDQTRTVTTFKATLQLSTYVGTALCGFLLLLSRPLVLMIMGSGSVNPMVLSAALRYVRIPSLGMPAAAIIGSAQSACLGMYTRMWYHILQACFLFMAWNVLLKGFYSGQKICLSLEYGLYFAAVPWFMLRVKKASLAGAENLGLPSVWKVFLGYQLVRCAIWLSRAFVVTRKEIRLEILTDSIGSKIVGDGDDTAGHSKISAGETTVREGINLDDSREVVLN